MTHAFVVVAHTDPAMLGRLVSTLADHGCVHLNVNGRVDLGPFAQSVARSRLLEPRVVVRWGNFSLVEAALRLSRQALQDPAVEQVTWLSGQHYPLVHPRVVVGADPVDRITLCRAPDAGIGKPDWRFRHRFVDAFPSGSRLDSVANRLARRLPPTDYERILGEHRLYAGTAWWSLTRRTLTEMIEWLDRETAIRRYFARLPVPDESVFHTAVGAVLTERARREGDPRPDPTSMTRGATTFARWGHDAHPEPLDAGSIRAAAGQGWWFARKFGSDRPDLLDVAEESWRAPPARPARGGA